MPSLRIRVAAAAGICVLASPMAGFAEPESPPSAAGAGRAGNVIVIDPQTGKRVPGPSRGITLPPDPAFSTSHDGLVEEPAPGGGMMIDLQGRFRSAATATTDGNGKVHVDCVHPGAADRKE